MTSGARSDCRERMAKAKTTATKPARVNRVQLPTQRVKQTTIDKLERLRPVHKGLGKAIDYAVEAAKE